MSSVARPGPDRRVVVEVATELRAGQVPCLDREALDLRGGWGQQALLERPRGRELGFEPGHVPAVLGREPPQFEAPLHERQQHVTVERLLDEVEGVRRIARMKVASS